MTEQEVMSFIRERLSKQFKIDRMILFGSQARGDTHESSDYDVLVVSESDVPFIKRQGVALLSLGTHQFALDLLVYTNEELSQAARTVGSAVATALSEGREYAV